MRDDATASWLAGSGSVGSEFWVSPLLAHAGILVRGGPPDEALQLPHSFLAVPLLLPLWQRTHTMRILRLAVPVIARRRQLRHLARRLYNHFSGTPMKKFLVLVLAIGLVSCIGDKSTPTSPTQPKQPAPVTLAKANVVGDGGAQWLK